MINNHDISIIVNDRIKALHAEEKEIEEDLKNRQRLGFERKKQIIVERNFLIDLIKTIQIPRKNKPFPGNSNDLDEGKMRDLYKGESL